MNDSAMLYEKINDLEKRFSEIGFDKGGDFIKKARYMIKTYVENETSHAREVSDMVSKSLIEWSRLVS